MNHVTLEGNAGVDAEIATFDSGTKKANFTLATSFSYKHGEDWKTKTTWHIIEAWAHLADKATKIKKGDNVLIEGEINVDEWNDDDGNKKTKYYIRAKSIKIFPKNKTTSTGATTTGKNQTPPQNQGFEPDPDDLPF